jgi:hypothetical protein
MMPMPAAPMQAPPIPDPSTNSGVVLVRGFPSQPSSPAGPYPAPGQHPQATASHGTSTALTLGGIERPKRGRAGAGLAIGLGAVMTLFVALGIYRAFRSADPVAASATASAAVAAAPPPTTASPVPAQPESAPPPSATETAAEPREPAPTARPSASPTSVAAAPTPKKSSAEPRETPTKAAVTKPPKTKSPGAGASASPKSERDLLNRRN